MCEIDILVGKTISKVELNKDDSDDFIIFETMCGGEYKIYHPQDCCEQVYIEDICGDLQDLVGQKVERASEESGELEGAYESGTWTFYVIDTFKGSVTIRWKSNGYYSEAVYFVDMNDHY
jgi:hypothetical protein